jgi:hypothetical protein
VTRGERNALLASGVVLAVSLTACAAGWLREPVRPAETFSHAAHRDVLGPRGFSCVVCHPFTIDVLERVPAKAAELSHTLMMPGRDACHHCHTDAASPVTTVRRCTLCHEDIRPLRPKDHDALWSVVHGTRARVEGPTCNDCHRESDCVRCHLDRNAASRSAHDPTYLSFHAVEARLEPARCQRCHTSNFCTRCHRQGEPTW